MYTITLKSKFPISDNIIEDLKKKMDILEDEITKGSNTTGEQFLEDDDIKCCDCNDCKQFEKDNNFYIVFVKDGSLGNITNDIFYNIKEAQKQVRELVEEKGFKPEDLFILKSIKTYSSTTEVTEINL